MYYKYDSKYELIEKSETELTGDRVVIHSEDIDINLFRVIVGQINSNKEMLRYTKFIRSPELISRELDSIKTSQAEFTIDLDFRLSMIELGI